MMPIADIRVFSSLLNHYSVATSGTGISRDSSAGESHFFLQTIIPMLRTFTTW